MVRPRNGRKGRGIRRGPLLPCRCNAAANTLSATCARRSSFPSRGCSRWVRLPSEH